MATIAHNGQTYSLSDAIESQFPELVKLVL